MHMKKNKHCLDDFQHLKVLNDLAIKGGSDGTEPPPPPPPPIIIIDESVGKS